MKKLLSSLLAVAMAAFILPQAPTVSATTLQITTTSLPEATVGQVYSQQLQASGGTSPYTWETVSTTYPSACCVLGLSGTSGLFNTQSTSIVLNPAGTYSWVIKVTDAVGATATKTLSLVVKSAPQAYLIVSSSFVQYNYTKGDPLPQSPGVTISNNSTTETINYTISVPNQPSWLNVGYATDVLTLTPLNTAGVGVGVDPTGLDAGTYTTTIYFTGNFSNSPASIEVTLNVLNSGSSAPQITTTSLPDATAGQAYSTTIQVSGGTSPYTWETVSTTYPSACCVLGLNGNDGPISVPYITFNTQSSAMVLSTNIGTYSWVIKVTDANGSTATKTLSLKIKSAQSQSPSITITTNSLPAATVGQPYSAVINFTKTTNYALNATISGQPDGIGWQGVSGPNANVGIIFNNTTISGTPTQAGTYTVRLTLTDQYNPPVSKDFVLVVNPAATAPSTGGINLPDGTVLKIPGDPTVYLISGGKIKPFTSANEFLGQGYKWSDVQEVDSSQVANVPLSGGDTPSFYPYPSGSLINDNGTIYFISGHTKVPFTNWQAFDGLGYLLKNVVAGDLTNYVRATNYLITTANATHPWGSWVIHNGTVYYSSQDGLIGVPSAQVFTSNGGNWNLLVKANSYDVEVLNANPNLPVLELNDPRVYSASAQ